MDYSTVLTNSQHKKLGSLEDAKRWGIWKVIGWDVDEGGPLLRCLGRVIAINPKGKIVEKEGVPV